MHSSQADLSVVPDHARNPQVVLPAEHASVVGVTCGGSHTLFQTASGRLFASGRGEYGRCGSGDVDTHLLPTLVDTEHIGPVQVLSVSAGGSHSALVAGVSRDARVRLQPPRSPARSRA